MPEIESIRWGDPIFFCAVFLFGCCVGSYLNVVIYRLPRGLSSSDPKRSFCPACSKQIPLLRNIPLFTWLVQRGKCAECAAPIPARYFIVELLTGLVWLGLWWFFTVYCVQHSRWIDPDLIWFPGVQAGFFILLATLAIVISFIDIEHMIIPVSLSLSAALVSIVAAVVVPEHLGVGTWSEGLKVSLIGGATGLVVLYSVVRLGKWMFGKYKIELDQPITWSVRDAREGSSDPNENVCLILDGEENFWHDLFFRRSDKVTMEQVEDLIVNGRQRTSGGVVLKNDKLILEDEHIPLEKLKSVSGTVRSIVIPREAMGMGDVHLLGVIGLALGYQSLLLVILSSCLIGILFHIIAIKGRGKPFPFGPCLILGGCLWILCGPELFEYFLEWTQF